MRLILFLLIFTSISGFGKTFKVRVIDDITKKSLSNVKLVVDNTDTLYTDIYGVVEYTSEKDIIHIDAYKLSYKFEHYDIDLKDVGEMFLIPMHPLDFHLHTIIVESDKSHSTLDSFILSSYRLNNKEINANLQTSFGESLQSIKGVDIRSMGSAPTRPIFRGLSNDRLKINSDGYLNIDLSASSPDHNVAIDPQSIKEASLLRGPKTLKYSSSSSAGILDLKKNDIPIEKIDSYNFDVKNYIHSNNLGVMNFIESAVNVYDLFNLKTKASFINSDNIQTPKQELSNTKINSKNYAVAIGKESKNSELGVIYDYYENNFGIPPGPSGTHPKGVNIEMYRHNIKFLFNYHFHQNKYIKDMNLNYLYNNLFHEEFESSGAVGARYLLQNNLIRLDFEGEEILYSDKSSFGLSFSDNFYDAGAAVRTPEVKDNDLAIYLIQSYEYKDFDLEFAFRNENKFYNPIKDESVSNDLDLKSRFFSTKSISISNIYKKVKNTLIGSIFSYDERIPTLEELYSQGPHLASYSYDIGNQELKLEKSVNIELFYSNNFSLNDLKIENSLNLFNYYFFNFITPRNTGEIDLIRTRLPIFENQGLEANLYGFEQQLTLNYKRFIIKNTSQFTYGQNLDNKRPLPMIPPLKNFFQVKYKQEKFDISIIIESANSQTNIDEFETVTESYTIFNIKSNYYFYFLGMQNQVVLNIRNLFNTTYRNHLSRIKEIMPESGRNISIGISNYL